MPVPDPAAFADALPPGDAMVEVGVGTYPDVAAVLADRGVSVTVTDVEHRSVPPEVSFVCDDVTDPDQAVYAGVDVVYSIHCPPELHTPLTRVADRVGAACRFTTLGGDPPTVPAAPRSVGTATMYIPESGPGTRRDGGAPDAAATQLGVDAVVLDVDGVLVDVADSYRRAVVDSVDVVYGETVERAAVQSFKAAGGFNDDWAVTDAVALYILAQREAAVGDVEAFTDAVDRRGGGVAAAEATVRDRLEDGGATRVFERWDRDRLRDVFQQLYLGRDLYTEFESGDADVGGTGYIWDEPVIATASTMATLRSRFRLGVLTGRPEREAALALDRVGLDLPDAQVVTRDDWGGGKPEPTGLVELAEALDCSAVAYVGDTRDDVRTAQNAGDGDRDRAYYGVGALSGGLSGATGRSAFQGVGADLVVSSVNDLPQHLTQV